MPAQSCASPHVSTTALVLDLVVFETALSLIIAAGTLDFGVGLLADFSGLFLEGIQLRTAVLAVLLSLRIGFCGHGIDESINPAARPNPIDSSQRRVPPQCVDN